MEDTAGKPEKTSVQGNLAGRQLGDFQLLRRLGRGAMAEVYLAEQLRLKRRVAVKVLKPELADDATYLNRFQREAQAAASLVHANIVQIYEVGHHDQFHYIAQEYVEGQNLRQWLGRHGPADMPRALSIMVQVAAALAKAAKHGVVHRDIKPENIMLTPSGEVKVADFGLARVARPDEKADLTQVGITLGTPLYMSPEQVEGKPLDPRSDLYSFGVTCYHMLAGRPPFRGETALGVAVQHLKTEPEPLEKVRQDLPQGLCRLVDSMLAKRPEDRYQSAGDVLRDLRRLQQQHATDEWPDDLPGSETLSIELPTTAQAEVTQQLGALMETVSQRRPSRRRRWVLAAGLLATFCVGGLLAWLTTRQPPLLPAGPAPPLTVPRQQTPLRQYMDADKIGTKEAWRSVIEYFPDQPYFVNRAKQKLGQLYLQEGDYDRALAIYDELAASDSDELRSYGLAGRYGVLTLLDRNREAGETLKQLWPIRRQLNDLPMQQMLDYAIKRNRSKLGAQTVTQWEQWLDDQFGEKTE